jgi:hypothetical protein
VQHVAERVEAVVPGQVADGDAVLVQHGDEAGRASPGRGVGASRPGGGHDDERRGGDEVTGAVVDVVDHLVEHELVGLAVQLTECGVVGDGVRERHGRHHRRRARPCSVPQPDPEGW